MGFGAAQVSKGEKAMLDQVRAAVSQASPGPEPSRPARGAHRQLSASAVGSTHQIVRRPEEGRLADYERGPEVARARLEQGRHSLRSDV
jgi:hypothetical protein